MYLEGNVVVEIGEGDPVLSANRLPNDDLVDVIELIPVFVSTITSQTLNSFRSSSLQSRVKHLATAYQQTQVV